MKFNQTILSCLFLLIFSGSSFSQDTEAKQPFSWGMKVGVIAGTPIGPSEEGATGSPGIGLHIGVAGKYDISERWSVQGDVVYNQKKAKYKTPVRDQDYEYEQIFEFPDTTIIAIIPTYFNGEVEGEFYNHYLEVPLNANYKLSKRWYLTFGIYGSYLIKGSHQVIANGIVGDNFDTVENRSQDETEGLNKWDYGLNTGVRYQVGESLNCELRISSGMRSIFNDDYQLAEDTVRNLYLQLSFGYDLGILWGKLRS